MTKEQLMKTIEDAVEKYQYQEFHEIVAILVQIYNFLDANECRLDRGGKKE